ncbi:MAG: Na+/H+ antiporter subunit E [Rhizobiaceae bacterium]|jgi:multicomponent Na+:H+ antiporter subunit E|nr:Na+/H+ antiporter subunit E [Rhizobiaceae bacterium]
MIRNIMGALGLVALWLLMSGVYKPLVLILGAISVLLALTIANRMDRADGNNYLAYPISVIAAFRYLLWLLVEIAKSNWAVTKIILSPGSKSRQNLFTVPVSCKSEIGQVIFASSITLTPGTITVETEDEHFIVHALSFSDDDMDALADMDARVRAIETEARD